MTMLDRILRHLDKYGSITTWQAIKEYGCTRLSHYIYLAKKLCYSFDEEWIKTKNRFNEKIKYKKYILKKGGNNGRN